MIEFIAHSVACYCVGCLFDRIMSRLPITSDRGRLPAFITKLLRHRHGSRDTRE